MEKIECMENVNQEKIWIICQRQHFLYNEFKNAGYIIFDPFIGCNSVIPRFVRTLHFKSPLPLKKIWFRKLPGGKPEIIILREGIASETYLKWLRNAMPDTKIIGLFMNKLRGTKELELMRKYDCVPATGDLKDRKKYNISNEFSAVYLRHFKAKRGNIKGDVLYIGKAKKGREDVLNNIVKELETQGLSVNTYLTSPFPYGITFGKYKKQIPYSEVLKKIGQYRAILHLSMGASSGITFRVMESVINRIKLITDDLSILQTEVYNPNNIFILGKDDITTIGDFMRKPFVDIDNRIIDSFYFNTDLKKYLEQIK